MPKKLPPKDEPDVILSARVPESLREDFRAVAFERKIDYQVALAEAVSDWITKHKAAHADQEPAE